MEFYNCSMFCCGLLCVHSSFSIISMGTRELIALLCLSSWCVVIVVWLFLMIPLVCLQFVIVVFPDHAHLHFFTHLWSTLSFACILKTPLCVFRIGRKMTLCISSIFYLVSAMSIAWTPNYPVYLLLIFSVGFFSVGNFMPAYVLGKFYPGFRYEGRAPPVVHYTHLC